MFLRFFLFSYVLSNRQVSDCDKILVKITFQSFFGSLLNHLYPYANENVSMRHLSLICITSILTTIYSLKNCSVYGRSCRGYKPKSLRFFRKEFRKVKKKKSVIYQLKVGSYGEKLWPRSWVHVYFVWAVIILIALVGVSWTEDRTQPKTEDQRPITEISRTTLCEALKCTLSVESLFVEDAGIKVQNEDLRENASSNHEILTWYRSLCFVGL